MRAPEFWTGKATGRDAAPMLQALLAPAGFLYGVGAALRRRWTKPARVSIPVVCVGNLTLGGAGKTPVARAVRAKLGEGAHVLLRGYGGRARGPLSVDPHASFRDVGDEALLHAADGPTWIARDRVAGARAAAEAGARVIVMDDGFQNPSLHQDLSIVVIDAEAGIGNGKVFPAGPLRERLADGVARADEFVFLRPSPSREVNASTSPPRGGEVGARSAPGEGARQKIERSIDAGVFCGEPPPHPAASRPPSPPHGGEGLDALRRLPLTGRGICAFLEPISAIPPAPLVAFAGIARPAKFFDTLRSMGAEIAESIPYPDHHAFGARELDWLAKLAEERGARLITTEKDHVRLDSSWGARVAVLKVAARFEDEAALDALIEPIRARMR